jgi:glutamyl-tRNA synthetase
MMAVVVDDIDMGVTHVIRGDDHLSNTPKQVLIYQALGASIPEFAHIPLINDMDGKKLSKRRGAVAAEDYKKQGFLPEALVNYLLKLGFSYGDKEFFTKEEMIKYFSLSGIGLAPARFDISKLRHINQFYLKNKSNNDIINLISEDIHIMYSKKLNDIDLSRLEVIMDELKKCSTLNEVTSALGPYLTDFTLCYTEEALQVIKSCGEVLNKLQLFIQSCNFDNFDSEFKAFLATNGFAFKQVGPVLRSVLIGKTDSTAISLIVKTLGKDEVKKRVLGFCLS